MDGTRMSIPYNEQCKIMADAAPVLIWLAEENRNSTAFNAGWLAFTGRALEQESGMGWTNGVHPEDLEHCLAAYKNAYRDRTKYRTEYRLKRFDGLYCRLLETGVPRFNDDGDFAGFIGSCVDIEGVADLTTTNQDLHLSRQHLTKLNTELGEQIPGGKELDKLYRFFMQAPAGICVLSGPELVFEMVNPVYQGLLPGRDLLNRPIFEALPELDQSLRDILLNVYITGKSYEVNELLIPVAAYEGGPTTDRYFTFNYTPRVDEQGWVEGILVFVFEVSAVVSAKIKFAESEYWLRSLVMTAHYPLMILRGREWVIEIANQPLVNLWDKTIEEVTGRRLMDILPEIEGQPFPDRLRQVYDTGRGYGEKEQVFHYNSPEGPAVKYVSYYYDALLDPKGEVCGIIVSAEDITERVTSRQLLEQSYSDMQALNEELRTASEEVMAVNEELTETQEHLRLKITELAASESRFRSLIHRAPVAIALLRSQELLVESANEMMFKLWGKSDAILGQPLSIALPEIKEQGFLGILDTVITSGETYYGDEVPVMLEHEGILKTSYVNFVYQPVKNVLGEISDIIAVAVDVTEQVNARKTLERAEEQLRFSVEAANAATWYMDAVTHEFIPSARLKEFFGFADHTEVSYQQVVAQIPIEYRELIHTAVQKSLNTGESYAMEHPITGYDGKHRWVRALGKMYAADGNKNAHFSGLMIDITELVSKTREKQRALDLLKMNEQNIRNMILQAPVGICILKGEPLFVQEINDAFVELLGKPREELESRPYWEVNAEGESFYKPITDLVLKTGETYHAWEHEIMLIRNGIEETVYVDFVYEPVKNLEGEAEAIMIVAIEVTDKVLARKKVEWAEESLRLAIDAAELGSYYINAEDRIFVASPRLKEFFGFEPDEEVPYEAAINQIHPDYRQAAADLVEASFQTGKRFDMEYPVVGYHDGRIRWVRGIGTIQRDTDGKGYFTGVLHEITERKQDEQRKNDFIAMVSHELKTPLTSLTGIVQLLQRKLKDAEDNFVSSALDKAQKQIRKMIVMINGFLNVSRLESGKIQLDKQDFDLILLIKEAVEDTELTSVDHDFSMPVHPAIQIHADRDKIGSVISNLLSNAVKYSPKGKLIELDTVVSDGMVTVRVKDQGMGIKQQNIRQLFDRYYRVESDHTQNIAGFGIGLYLSSEIIAHHGGEIGVESESGKGSTFWFKLPLNETLSNSM